MSNSIGNFLICRTCLSENGEKTCIFDMKKFEDIDSRICDVMGFCASIQVCKGDGLPELMCMQCIEELKRAFLFRKLCEKSDATLRHLVVSTPSGEKMIKVEPEDDIKPEFSNFTVNKHDEEPIETEDNYSETYDDMYHVNINNASNDADEYDGHYKCEDNLSEEDNSVQNPQQKQWCCKKCNITFETRYKYRKHKGTVHDPSRECHQCGTRFENSIARDTHECNPDDILRIAKLKMASRNYPTTCNVCHKSVLKMNLARHLHTHTGEKPFICNICGKGFTQRSSLKTHTYIHTDDKPFKCEQCDKSFGDSVSLRAHMATHTGEKPFSCNVCSKGFTRRSYLKVHMVLHTGEKIFKCEVCDKNFINANTLNTHKRTHTGEKPYECTECGRCFAVKEVLKNHMRRHTGERPFACTICGWAFAKSSTMVKHMKVHKANDEVNN